MFLDFEPERCMPEGGATPIVWRGVPVREYQGSAGRARRYEISTNVLSSAHWRFWVQKMWVDFPLKSSRFFFAKFLAYLMLIRYCARATDSALPEMVIVRSIFPPDSRSSQLEIRIIAPLNCLQEKLCEILSPCLHIICSRISKRFCRRQTSTCRVKGKT